MNTLKKIGSIVLAAILMTGAASFSANAQFKGLGNKLKGKVEKTVKEKVEKKKLEAKEAVKKSTGVDSESESDSGTVSGSSESEVGGFDYKKTYTPGDEAKAADPLATSTEVWEGFNKSVGQLHGAYENMADFTVNYQPYYADNNKYYWVLNKDSENRILNAFLSIFKLQMASDIDHKKTLDMWGEVEDGMVIPADEMFLNAYQTQYIADPTSTQALLFYLYADTYLNNMAFSQFRYALKDDFTTEDGNILPKNFYTQRKERRQQADQLANTVTSYDTMLGWAEKYFDNAYSQNNPYAAYFQLLIGENILKNCLPNHKDFNEDNTRYRKLVAKVDGSKDWKIQQAFVSSFVDPNLRPDWIPKNPGAPVAMPKGVAVSAAVQKEAENAAKAYAGNYYKKVIFKNGKWFDLKSHEWPYRKTVKRHGYISSLNFRERAIFLKPVLQETLKATITAFRRR